MTGHMMQLGRRREPPNSPVIWRPMMSWLSAASSQLSRRMASSGCLQYPRLVSLHGSGETWSCALVASRRSAGFCSHLLLCTVRSRDAPLLCYPTTTSVRRPTGFGGVVGSAIQLSCVTNHVRPGPLPVIRLVKNTPFYGFFFIFFFFQYKSYLAKVPFDTVGVISDKDEEGKFLP